MNKIQPNDIAIHDWYQFVLGYPPHLVRYFIDKFEITTDDIILDPFSGTGTTVVEASINNIQSVGIEANPITYFASKVKTYQNYDVNTLKNYLGFISRSILLSYNHHNILESTLNLFENDTELDPIIINTINDLPPEQFKMIPKDFISPKPLKKVLIIREIIEQITDEVVKNFFRLALATFLIKYAGNVGFGPEVYKTKPKEDVESFQNFVSIASSMIKDVESVELKGEVTSLLGDSRNLSNVLPQELIGQIRYIITSPPYPNEKDYTRTTRLESVFLDFIKNRKDLRSIKENLLRSNSRNIYVKDNDKDYIKDFSNIKSLAEKIENKRIELKKTSGFEKLYHKIVLHYFGGMYKHLKELKPYLADNAKLAYVVGDQASFFRILIPTAELLAEIAENLGYTINKIEVWRTRLATATKSQLNENILIFEKVSAN